MNGDASVFRGDDAVILGLEASTARGSVAVFRGETCLAHRPVTMGASRNDALFPAIMDVMAAAEVGPGGLGAVVCGSGPGSFTSLRMAAATAKGLCEALQRPLLAVSSLALAAAAHGRPGDYLVHSDALRGDRYGLPVRIDADGMVHIEGTVGLCAAAHLDVMAGGRVLLAVDAGTAGTCVSDIANLMRVAGWRAQGPMPLDLWEPAYGRLAEAQVQWERAHARPLPS